MNKSPEAFRTISEVAETLDVPPHVLRFWETRFTQVKPVKRGGGRRYYRPEDVRLLRGIRGLLYDDGMTIKGVQKNPARARDPARDRARHTARAGRGGPGSAVRDRDAAPGGSQRLGPRESAARSLRTRRGDRRGRRSAGCAAPAAAGVSTVTAEAPKPLDKPALRSLVAKLQALRAVMIDEAR